MTTQWSRNELDVIGTTMELSISSTRLDGTARPQTTIWVVRVGDDLYVRSFRGPFGSWYRAARRTGRGHIRAGGVEREVSFEEPAEIEHAAIDDAYRSKYGRSSYVDAMATPDAADTTLRLIRLERAP